MLFIFEDPLKIHCLDPTPIVFEVGSYCFCVGAIVLGQKGVLLF